ncbi:hypothetical protein [Calycomorphotria hydatis]|uniref:hypothetical protein n=1 Tax=Calycomorphotria hydatis TaxID=2528027 RepID=UPI0018D2416C|nr:hypothetical protein [Calycomorphotria hydatis]
MPDPHREIIATTFASSYANEREVVKSSRKIMQFFFLEDRSKSLEFLAANITKSQRIVLSDTAQFTQLASFLLYSHIILVNPQSPQF